MPLTGPIPDKLEKHRFVAKFAFGFVGMNGPPLPPVESRGHALKILILPVVLGYADLASDLITAVSYKADHPVWFALGLVFALGPPLIMSVFFLSGVETYRRVLVVTQLSLLYEAFQTGANAAYSPVLALVRVAEPLFESVPQLLLQLYAMLRLWMETSSSRAGLFYRVASVSISMASLAYAATDVSSVERLSYYTGWEDHATDGFRLCPCLPFLTGFVFSRVPRQGTLSYIRGFGNVHPRTHVWFCAVYHVLEIVSRFISLAMLFLVLGGWLLLVLPYLWISRVIIVWTAAWRTADLGTLNEARKALDFRFRVRLVAMPFLDSIVDGPVAFGLALGVTLVEFVLCVCMYHELTQDDISASARLTMTIIAISCMVGKMLLAWAAIFPLVSDERGFESQSRFLSASTSMPREVEGPIMF